MKNEKYKGFQKIRKIFVPILSLLITFLLLYLLFENIKAINEGDHSGNRYLLTISESIALFLIPFIFNPKAVNKRINKNKKPEKPKKSSDMDLKIQRLVKLDGHYTASIIKKCPNCGFVNTKKTKICYNCSYKLNWEAKDQNEQSIIMKCPKCSFTNPRTTKICHNCGFKLN
ncbi:zinc ribbon domain-containing protein [Promethearchaeum syntrophicum]|uniref:Zinc ribbon domain-containing protein n=1 Tax=Promethearchaeum syntrophicum TaxID=2594042 RepID=A0A5B9DA91_9ARCH|nr:zinc ribbon domain-containing protein [Candidatus Prometheoarchaeum syntrophicum]QEE15865.1 Double zinc ribbon [Candidatus Prometheoarchaeum syntrophicum]